jgi:CubicO group peptidase (beta-lactamase class C family)
MDRFKSTIGLLVLFIAGCGGGSDGGNSGVVSISCPALQPPPSPTGSLASVVDGIAATEMQSRHLPGLAIAISKRGTIIYAQGYGYANLKSCLPVQASMTFQLGSVTKQFTAVATLQLVNQGNLGLDRAISEVLPAYGFDPRITIRMLLNQTSGLDDYTSFPEAASWTSGVAQQTVLTRIVQAPLLFAPGTAYSYSNSNYYILGSIIESVTASSYADYLTANVLRPANLDHTFYLQPLSSAAPYTPSWTDGPLWDPSTTFAAGALWSSVLDLAAWNSALVSNTVLPESSFALTVTPPDVPSFKQSKPSQYGMGWLRTNQLGRPFVLHDGATGSYSAFNGMFLDDGFSIAILTNIALPNGGSFESTAATLINAVCGASALAGTC